MPEEIASLSAVALDHFEHPRNSGELVPASDVFAGSAGGRDRGAQVLFTARIRADRIEQMLFRAWGCPHTIAAASWVTERLSGSTVQSLTALTWQEMEAALAVPLEKRGRLLILEDALRSLARHAAANR
jgi:nitrogen fixation NifU-like protein